MATKNIATDKNLTATVTNGSGTSRLDSTLVQKQVSEAMAKVKYAIALADELGVSIQEMRDIVNVFTQNLEEEIRNRLAGDKEELERALAAEADLLAQLNQEIANREKDVDDEEFRAKLAENRIEVETKIARDNLQSKLETDLANEAKTRETNDNKLFNDLTVALNELNATLTASLNAEAATRLDEDTKLSNRLIAEQVRAEAAEKLEKETREQAIADERARAELAEKTEKDAREALDTRLSKELSDTDDKLTKAIDDEETRAISEESRIETTLNKKIDDETKRADTAEKTELARATLAESGLSDRINTEAETRKTEDDKLTKLINDNETDIEAKVAKEILDRETAIEAEKQAREAQDSTLSTSLTNLDSRHTTQINDLRSDLTDFQNAQANKNASLDQDIVNINKSITNEIQARLDSEEILRTDLERADDELNSKLTEEADTRKAKDEALQTNITNEVNRAEAAEKVLTDNLASEVTRATEAEKTLTNSLSAEITRATGVESGLRADLTDETADRKQAIIDEASARESADNTLTDNLSAEITRAKAVEKTLDNRITNEANTAATARDTLKTDLTKLINDETDRATKAEAEEVINRDAAIKVETDRAIAAETAEKKAREDVVKDINDKISTAASATNKLIDKKYVDDLAADVASNSAHHLGNYETLHEFVAAVESNTLKPTNNDYVYVNKIDLVASNSFSDDLTAFNVTHAGEAWRFVYNKATGLWGAQFRINERPFTAAEQAALDSGINAEVLQNLHATDSTLDSKIGTTKTDLETKITTQRTEVNTAIKAVDDKVEANKAAISNETTRATKAETDLQTNINNTNTALTAEIERAKAAEKAISDELADEKKRSKDLDDVFTTTLDAEIERAKGAEEALDTKKLDQITATGPTRVYTIQTDGSQTTTTVAVQPNANTLAQRGVAGTLKASTPTAADDATTKLYVDNAIETEKTRAENAESTNATDISDLQTKATQLESSLGAEVTRAKKAEEDLETNKLDKQTGTARVYILDGSGTNSTMAYSSETSGAGTIARRTSEGALRVAQFNESSTDDFATPKKYVDDINKAETTRAMQVENNLATGLSSEISNRTAADTTIDSNAKRISLIEGDAGTLKFTDYQGQEKIVQGGFQPDNQSIVLTEAQKMTANVMTDNDIDALFVNPSNFTVVDQMLDTLNN